MSRSLRAAMPLLGGIVLTFLGCSVPPLESQLEGGPTVSDIVNHINCELALIVNPNPFNARLNERIALDPTLVGSDAKLDYLTRYHFVASVLMNLDSLDSQGVNPSLTFINPISGSTMFNRTFTIGGSLTGSQERNISLGYSVDLAELRSRVNKRGEIIDDKIARYCKFPTGTVPVTGTALRGDLGLTDIVVDGLLGLDAANQVNVYGPSGPTLLPVSVPVTKLTLNFGAPSPPASPSPPCPPAPCPSSSKEEAPKPKLGKLTIENGNMTFTPSTTEATAPGTVTFTGTGTADDGTKYFINLTGSAVQPSKYSNIIFSLSGTMAKLRDGTKRDEPRRADWSGTLGFAPSLSLAGTINYKHEPGSLAISAGSTKSEKGGDPITVTPEGRPQTGPQRTGQPSAGAGAFGGGGGGGGGGGAAKTSGAPSAGSTLFGTIVSFIVSYGLNGGPNWTLMTFKGPSGGGGGGGGGGGSSGGGGGGGGGQLANLSRTNTDTLTITFVAACKNEPNKSRPTNYWESLPRCDEYARAGAVSLGAANNLLIQSGRGL